MPLKIRCDQVQQDGWLLWDTHTHMYFSEEIRDVIKTVLLILNRMRPDIPPELRIMIIKFFMDRQ